MPTPIGPDIGIEHAQALKDALSPQLASRRNVVIDASAVERVHTAGLQVLAAFVRERGRAGHGTRLDRPTDTLVEAARRLGLQHALGLDDSGDTR
ncbi:MAG: STAS domain-containing protein [Lysobacteraceae bacterium]